MSDEEIIGLYRKRDKSAIARSEETYGGYCMTVAGNILGSREDSEECVSDTWFAAWNAIPPASPVRLKMFFARITRNLAVDRLRRSGAQKWGGGEAALSLEEQVKILLEAGREAGQVSVPPPDFGVSILSMTDSRGEYVMTIYGGGCIVVLGKIFNVGEENTEYFINTAERSSVKSELMPYGESAGGTGGYCAGVSYDLLPGEFASPVFLFPEFFKTFVLFCEYKTDKTGNIVSFNNSAPGMPSNVPVLFADQKQNPDAPNSPGKKIWENLKKL